jgi:GT2 family glycosyltransferase
VSPSVAALVVSHDGARWLPTVIDGIKAQTRPPDRVVSVDTTSRDESPALLAEAFGEVVTATGSTSFPAAVRLGLEHVGDSDWIWILHDDSTPAPDALAELLAAAAADPDADVLGPKLREWPSLRRLLELGVTISGTGRRETGLERGEYDQGQHDEVRTVLAVNTAGMLVRREALEALHGFDSQLPIFGNDIDFGWRAASAGYKTIVVPQAVVFHAEAAHRGARRTPLTGRHTHYQERRAALYTLLVNSRARTLPFQLVRLGFGTLLRMIGFLLLRSVGEALDELAALVSLYSSPREILSARKTRQGQLQVPPAEVRRLLAPRWLPYRHGLDFLSDLAAAATNQAADVAERRRAAALAESGQAPRRPTEEDDDEALLTEESGWLVRYLTNPVAVMVTVVVVLAVIGARDAFGAVSGGALSPVPADAADWWQLHVEGWHPLAQGTAIPAPPYVVVMAVLSSVLLGSTSAALSFILVLAVPLSLWGAWRLLRVVGRLVHPSGFPTWLLAWGAIAYALVPVVSGAWGEGRFGVVASAVLLPWLAHAGLGFADPDPDRRWRAAWRSALVFALGAAFAPVIWWWGLSLAALLVAVGFVIAPRAMRDRSVWGPPAAAVATVPVLLAPWWISLVVHGGWPGLFFDAGAVPMSTVGARELLLGRMGDSGAPEWLGLLLVVLALLALLPSRTRIWVLVCWVVALVTALLAVLLGMLEVTVSAAITGAGLGFLVVALQATFVVATVLGTHGFVLGGLGSWRRVVAALVAIPAVAVPAVGLVWFVIGGHGHLRDVTDDGIPEYMVQEAMTGEAHGILVLRGDVADGLTYTVIRDDGTTLGEDEILALAGEDEQLTEDVAAMVAAPSPEVVADLPGHGIEYVVLPAPAAGSVAASLDATQGLTQASAEDRSTRAWQVDEPVDEDALAGPPVWLHTVLVVVQGLAVLVVVVLAFPTSQRRRREVDA